MEKEKIRYYETEQDDFANNENLKVKVIDENYRYIDKNICWKIISWIVYRLIMKPLSYLYTKIKFDLEIVNKNDLKKAKNEGAFLYLNHTQTVADAYIPNAIAMHKKIYVVVHPDNVSMPFLGKVAELSNGLPTPSNVGASKNFMKAISKCIDNKNWVAIYPEAHVWDYYTKIRDFKEESFRYPAKLNAPVYAITTTYRKRENRNPKIVAYVDGPFYTDQNKTYAEQKIELKNKVYDAMTERAKTNNVEYIKYIKKGEIT